MLSAKELPKQTKPEMIFLAGFSVSIRSFVLFTLFLHKVCLGSQVNNQTLT